jgi:hypothetical protein
MKLVFLIKILFLCNFFFLTAQTDPIIQGLDDPSPRIRQNTLYKIKEGSLIQYVSALEERIFNQPAPFLKGHFLETLWILDSPNIVSIALEYIEQADSFQYQFPEENPLVEKVFATKILISKGNYSTTDYVFEVIERDKPQVNENALDILCTLINHPSFENDAKQELLYIIYNAPIDFNRYYALSVLQRKYGTQLIQDYLNIFKNDLDVSTRILAFQYLSKFNYLNLRTILYQQLPLDPDWSLRYHIADTLLIKFGQPSDLKAVIDYQPNEPDTIAKSLMNFSIRDFIPPVPSSSVTTEQMAENLLAYTDELYEYEWITDQEAYEAFRGDIAFLIEVIRAQVPETICSTLLNILYMCEDKYNNELTTEGYKFLKYHTTYIRERVETEYSTQCDHYKRLERSK